jgi:hypothetical protein
MSGVLHSVAKLTRPCERDVPLEKLEGCVACGFALLEVCGGVISPGLLEGGVLPGAWIALGSTLT